jgi:hypothetical protein
MAQLIPESAPRLREVRHVDHRAIEAQRTGVGRGGEGVDDALRVRRLLGPSVCRHR